MSEFHRMITYLYLYERGLKSRNIGFAKIEKRDQRCLMEIHMKNTGCSLAPVPVYFYVQKDQYLAGISLGNFSLSRGIGDFKVILDSENIKDSGYTLDAVKGIYIPLTERIMLVSQWDDDEFDQKVFVKLQDLEPVKKQAFTASEPLTEKPLSNPENVFSVPPLASTYPKQTDSSGTTHSTNEPGKDTSNIHSHKPDKDTSNIHTNQPDKNTSSDHTNEPDENTSSNHTNQPDENTSSDHADKPGKEISNIHSHEPGKDTSNIHTHQPDENTSSDHTKEMTDGTSRTLAKDPGAKSPMTFTKDSETKIIKTSNNHTFPVASSPTINKPVSTVEDTILSSPKRETDTLNAAETAPASTEPKIMEALKALEALPRPSRNSSGFRTASRTNRNAKTNPSPDKLRSFDHSQADAPEDWNLRWRFILENYPVMTPFSGDENTLCVRMELKDLRQLPRQFWYLGNNSFLLHGFFNYRYLILGMTDTLGMKRWFIGVPGVFQNPERVMATLFGFPEFRSEKPSRINTGEFGYWYRYLNELTEMPGKDIS